MYTRDKYNTSPTLEKKLDHQIEYPLLLMYCMAARDIFLSFNVNGFRLMSLFSPFLSLGYKAYFSLVLKWIILYISH